MPRNVLIAVLAVVLSLLLSALAGFIEANFTQLGAAAMELTDRGRNAEAVRGDPDRVFRALEAFQLRTRFLYRPVTAICVGVLVALLGRTAPRRVTALAIAPFLFLVWDHEGWDMTGAIFSAWYLGLALAAVHVILGWRGRRGTKGSDNVSAC